MASPYDNAPGKIFIGGISPTTTQDMIQKYFEQYGELCDCVLMQDKATGKSRCFGFVTYKDAKILDDVLSKKHLIDGKEIDCKRAIPRDQQSSSGKDGGVYRTKKLFVGGLTQNTTEEQFRQYFEQFGRIEDSVIMVDKETGKSRGFGFVTFDSEDAVDKVVQRYNDNKIDGKWVECKRAQAKDVMSNVSKRGMKHGDGGGRDQSSHQRYDRGGSRNPQGQGYYQSSPPGNYAGKRGSRNPSSHDNYGGSYQGGYMQNTGGRPSNYDAGGAGGYNASYDYHQNPQAYDPSGYNARGGPAYSYPTDYPSGYNASYPNPYQHPYNGPYNTGYPSQYNASYGQQGYDPMGLGMMPNNPGTATSNVSGTPTQASDTTMASMTSMGVNPTSQYPTNVNYGTEAGYNTAAYGYPPGDYGQPTGYEAYGSVPQQGMDHSNRVMQGSNPVKYGGPAQVQSPSQMTGYPKQGQSEVGPIKGATSKKQAIEARFYQPY